MKNALHTAARRTAPGEWSVCLVRPDHRGGERLTHHGEAHSQSAAVRQARKVAVSPRSTAVFAVVVLDPNDVEVSRTEVTR